jgi:pyruvate formate lyase activating enzyme
MICKTNPMVSGHSRRTFLNGFCKGACAIALSSVLNPKGKAGDRTETPARFYESAGGKAVQCKLCFRSCLLDSGDTGHCEIRVNRSGKLMTMGYGNPGAVNIDPIEKKPLFHYLPGSVAFSIGLAGCNIDCKFCQNWQLAQARPGEIQTQSMSPAEIASQAKKNSCPTIAYTYSEPTTWAEFVLDCSDKGNELSLGSVVVSNGTWSPQVLDELLKRIKAIKIDLKSIEPDYYKNICNGELDPVLRTIERIKKSGVWLEIVNLVVTTLNDSESNFTKLAKWVKENIGPDVPLHFTRFHPMYQLLNLPSTPVNALDLAYSTATAEGLHYVYVGNVPGHPAQSTKCSKCGEILIERTGFAVSVKSLEKNLCKKCQTPLPGVFV